MKFQRTYSMRIQVDDALNAVEVNYPLSLEFSIVRNTFATANTGSFTLYNLSEKTRRLVFHNLYTYFQYRQIILQAGYLSDDNTPLCTIFQGNIKSALSVKNRENWITQIEANDGLYAMINGQLSATIASPYSVSTVMKNIAEALPKVAVGIIDLPTWQNSRPASFLGNAWDAARKICGNNTLYIDNEKVNAVTQGTYITPAQGIHLITADTGLLGSPRNLGRIIEVDIIFEPRIFVNQLVELESEESYYDGEYAVVGIHHHGSISGAYDGGCITTLQLWSGQAALEAAP